MTGINEVARQIHENAVAHGWWDTDRNFAEIVALIHSELSEALEEFRNNAPLIWWADQSGAKHECNGAFEAGQKPEGIAVELADVVIRILDYCGRRGLDVEEAIAARRAGFDAYTLPELVAECHYLLSMSYKEIEPRSLYFVECISLITFWVNENGGDFDFTISLKHEYNKSRPYRHGGKKC